MEKELVSPCGLYCGVCSILIAHRSDNQNFKQRLAALYNVQPAQIQCEGCLSETLFVYCQVCPIKTCAAERGYEGCYQCDEWPCEHVDNFIVPVGRTVMLRAIPQWRELGTEQWVRAEIERYKCPHCGYALFRGAKRCRQCRQPVDQD